MLSWFKLSAGPSRISYVFIACNTNLFSTLLFFAKTGYVYDLAEYIADIVNIEYQLVPTTEYGEWNEENETWSGMVGQLYERVIWNEF